MESHMRKDGVANNGLQFFETIRSILWTNADDKLRVYAFTSGV